MLILKGGTSINLFVFDLPRLSVDIDLDFNLDCTKDEMKEIRLKINAIIKRYLMINGYSLSEKSRNTHALDSSVYTYDSFFWK